MVGLLRIQEQAPRLLFVAILVSLGLGWGILATFAPVHGYYLVIFPFASYPLVALELAGQLRGGPAGLPVRIWRAAGAYGVAGAGLLAMGYLLRDASHEIKTMGVLAVLVAILDADRRAAA